MSMSTKLKSAVRSLTMILFACLCLGTLPVSAQGGRIEISGKVTDGDGAPVSGASVIVKNETTGGVTNRDGRYTISADPAATLVFSFLGMETKEVPVAGRKVVDVVLSGAVAEVGEVVVIGYGTQSRSTLTTSVSKIKSEDMAVLPTGSPLVNIQGKVPGVDIRLNSGQPGTTPSITIRGGTNVASNNTAAPTSAPLYIVDGVIRRNMSDINSNDIESIEILKDAASTAIYGTRAGNGIVMISTKKGKAGYSSASFTYNLSVETQAKRQSLASARDALWAERNALGNMFVYDAARKNNFLNGSYSMGTGNPRNSLVTTAFLDKYIADYGQAYVEDLLYNQGWETMMDPATPGKRLIFKDTDYQDEMFQTAINHNYNATFSGGNEKGTVYMSIGYLDQDGIVLGTSYKRWNASVNASYKVTDAITANASFDYALRKNTGVHNVEQVLARGLLMPRTMRLYYEDGLPAPGEMSSSFRSRTHQVYYQTRYNEVGRTNINLGFDWRLAKGLNLRPTFSYSHDEGLDHIFERQNEITTNRPVTANHDYDRQYQFETVLNYTNTFCRKHNLDALVGVSYLDLTGYDLHVTGNGGSSDYIETIGGTAPENFAFDANNAGFTIPRKTASLFGRVTYDFERKYLFSASLRYDGSSHLSPDERWRLYPGVSAGWNMHREKFWQPLSKVVSNFKLRASWGLNGSETNLNYNDVYGVYKAGYDYEGQAGILNTTMGNLGLTWEQTRAFDAGVEIGLLDNRVNLVLDLYHKTTQNRIISKDLAHETGFASIKYNYGELVNKGIELGINATVLRNRNFSWESAFTFSFVDTRIGKLPYNGRDKNRIGGATVYDEKSGQYIEVGGLAEGERPYAIYGYQMDGVYATDADAANAPFDRMTGSWWQTPANYTQQKSGGDAIWHDSNGDGYIDEYDIVKFGYITPDKIGAFTNTFRYKNLSLRVAMDYAMGHMISNDFKAQANAHARENFAMTTDVVDGTMWQKQGDIARLPRLYTDSDWQNKRNHGRPVPYSGLNVGLDRMTNSAYVSKGDYLAFREVTLNYTLRASWLRHAKISAVDLMAGVYNLGYWTAYDGLMPEQYGPDRGNYPRPRTFMFSIKLTM